MSVILRPDGQPATKRTVRIENPQLAKFAAYADDAFRKLELTVVCQTCGGTPTGGNASTDTMWKLECACTVRVLRNPGVH